MKLQIDPKRKLFKWGPIDSRPLLPEFWDFGLIDSIKKYKPGWPAYLGYFHDEKNTFITDYQKLYDNGEKIFQKYILPDRQFEKNHALWQKTLKKLEAKALELQKKKLSNLGDQELRKEFLEWKQIYAVEFWSIGALPEISNWGGEQLLGKELAKKIRKDEDFHLAMERLSAPEDFSFYQKEELNLLALKKVKSKNMLDKKLQKHQQEYFWMLSSYHHARVLPVTYFQKTLKNISTGEAAKKIREINDLKRNSVARKLEIIRKFKLSREILKIGRRLAFCVWWQDLRKAYIFKAIHISSLFLRELSVRKQIDFDDLHFYTVDEIEKLIGGRKLSSREIKRRREHFVIYFLPPKTIRFFSGFEAKKLAAPYLNVKIDRGTKFLKGIVVNRGQARGRVTIIQSAKELKKMKKGDILVSSMTAPDYIMALKKAVAVVTDEGGMTCHAAIVSRELKIPGIVGTKIATRVLKDGDLVEVDANEGVVKIIK